MRHVEPGTQYMQIAMFTFLSFCIVLTVIGLLMGVLP